MQTDLKIFKHLLQLNIFLHINEKSFITTLPNIDVFNKDMFANKKAVIHTIENIIEKKGLQLN